ncbi:MAG TPA: CHAD domain-containing protein, partial [Acidimicrobiia bacterium]|nr:CHAD domain-containing protein [Acidimicrobiia bacterium]
MLEPSTPIPQAVQTAAGTQLEAILNALSGDAGLGPDEATHDARKRTKKLRALLRLVRPVLDDDVYRRENRALRDAARELSAVRDAWVLVEALDGLMTPAGDGLTGHSAAPLRAALVQQHRDLQTGRADTDTPGRAAVHYERVLARVGLWGVPDRGWKSLEDGLEAVVRAGRQHMARACSQGRAEDFHEWRKQVKYLRHQFELIRPVWPEVLDAMAATAAEA